MNPHRLLLIEPPFYRLYHDQNCLIRFPLGLGYLAGAVLQQTTWSVRILNADFNIQGCASFDDAFILDTGFRNYQHTLRNPDARIWEEVAQTIREVAPTVVGISAKTQNFASAKRVAAIVKGIDPNILVILGGPHVTMAGPEVLDTTPEIDLAVLGEGEETLVELLHQIEHQHPLTDVPGILLRNAGQIHRTPQRPFAPDLDAMPFPADVAEKTLLHYERFPKTAFRYIFATRGCPYTCTFCGSMAMWGRKVRFRSVTNVVAEVQKLQQRGIRNIHFDDDTFGVKKSHLLTLCAALEQECPGLQFSCETSVNLIDPETVTALRKAGCVIMLLGVESGDEGMLKEIKKNITVPQITKAVTLLRRHGGPYLRIHAFFMVGFPEETEATMRATMRFMTTLAVDQVILSIFTPYPGLPLFEQCQKLGLIGDSFDHERFNHQSPENCFTARIPVARFRELVVEATRITAQRNRPRWWHPLRLFWRRLVWSLRTTGITNLVRQRLHQLYSQSVQR